jgi:phosphoribosylanthranilate isomerase
MKIKICGLKYRENLEGVIACLPDFVGFIFYAKSPRFVRADSDVFCVDCKGVGKIGVFVNETPEEIARVVETCGLDGVQLHGEESARQIEVLRKLLPKTLIVKAVSVAGPSSIACCLEYADLVDYFLFDTATPSYGGSGKQFDWSVLFSYQLKVPFILGGGLHPLNIGEVPKIHNLKGFDFNSKLEERPGIKSLELVKEAIRTVREESWDDNQAEA